MEQENNSQNKNNTQLVIFGASGDLSQRKLFPALFNLEKKNLLPEGLRIIGASRRPWSDDQFKQEVKSYLNTFVSKEVEVDEQTWSKFANRLQFTTVQFDNQSDYVKLKELLDNNDNALGGRGQRIVYYSVSPVFFKNITENVAQSGVLAGMDCDSCRIVVEKPFGSDFESAKDLGEHFGKLFKDEQVYRIDHVLSKNALSDILSFRKNNHIFNQLFMGKFIDHIQITYAEEIGIEDRGEFYEQAGAIRDMVQSHILEALALVMADIPAEITTESIHQARSQVLSSLQFAGKEDLVIGQYTGGKVRDQDVKPYTQEEDVAPGSQVETFVSLKLTSNLEDWQNVPVYLRTGKRMAGKYFDIHIVFKDAPDFPADKQNVLTIRVSPNSGINLRLWKSDYRLNSADSQSIDMSHCYKPQDMVDAYENLLQDVFKGNNLFFISLPEIYSSWQLIDKVKQAQKEVQLNLYQPGTKGPDAAEILISKDGKQWLDETISDFCRIY